MSAPLGAQRVNTRLHKIRLRLDKLQKRLEQEASSSIATKIDEERHRLMDRWPVSGAQIAAIERAKARHALAVTATARRLAQAHRSRRAGAGNDAASSKSSSTGLGTTSGRASI